MATYRIRSVFYSVALLGGVAVLGGCFPQSSGHSIVSPVSSSCPNCPTLPPGTAQYVWEEPMVDAVDVPPGLDPDGIYYRPAHQEIVEIRQGRWRYYNKNR